MRERPCRQWQTPSGAAASARRRTGPRLLLALAAGAVLDALACWPGSTQTGQSQPAPAVVQPAPVPPDPDQPLPSRRPGFVDELQKLLPAPLQTWPSIGTPQETIEGLNQRAKDAGDNLSRLSKQQVVSGRVKCLPAANGAPDCKAAANRLCTDNGFKEGRSVDSDSAEDCPASVLLSDKTPAPAPAECRVENFVIRALCQR